jgi:hypothetical protein
MGSLLGAMTDRPIFVLTADQDWAPEWAVSAFLDVARRWRVPLHIFRTNPSPVLDEAVARGDVEHGWHPNFLPGSSHGDTTSAVLQYCQTHFPGARTARSHCFAEDTFRWQALAGAGIVGDSQGATACQAELMPYVHWTGIVRFPVYFEDDVFFAMKPDVLDLDAIAPTLFSPGLKIFNFHPTFVACNTPSRAHYDAQRSRVFGTAAPAPGVTWTGRGTADVLEDVLGRVQRAGETFTRFHTLVDTARALLPSSPEQSAWSAFFGAPRNRVERV